MKKLVLVLGAILSMSSFVASTANAIILDVEVGDRPYFTHGHRYWAQGRNWCWVPGHWNRHHVWIHGHYGPC